MVKYSPDKVFNALGHPVRRRMVEQLAQAGTLSLSDLALPFTMSLPAVLKHADVLEKTGVVVSVKEGRVRYYALSTDALMEGWSWFKTMEAVWEGRFNRLAKHLADNKK